MMTKLKFENIIEEYDKDDLHRLAKDILYLKQFHKSNSEIFRILRNLKKFSGDESSKFIKQIIRKPERYTKI